MHTLPQHGRVSCSICFIGCDKVEFDRTRRTEDTWRITANPLAWGNPEAEIVVLGFSKGPTQAGALDATPHDAIAYKGGRKRMGQILRHVGLLPGVPDNQLEHTVSACIAKRDGRFHFGSLIRCTVERLHKGQWKGSGGGMLDKFVATPFGGDVAASCTTQFLTHLPTSTRLVVMFGMGSGLNYVSECQALFQRSRGGTWRWLNDVAYTDGRVTVVHVEHFASQGPLIGQWLGIRPHPRQRWGRMAQEAVESVFGNIDLAARPTI
jgi:hypothetical protein